MKKTIFILFLFIMECSLSCNNNSNEKKNEDTIVTKDTLPNGAVLYTRRIKNILLDSFTYSNNKISGVRKKLSKEDGYIIDEYRDGVPNGKIDYYYKNNTLLYSGFLKNDTVMVGIWTYYYPSGKIKAYDYFNSYGVLAFTKKYHEDGSSYLRQGQYIIQARWGSDTIKTGRKFDFSFDVATPPDDSIRVFMSDVVNLRGKETLKNLEELTITDNRSSGSKQIDKIGMQSIGLSWKRIERNGKEDSGYQIINVIGIR